MRRTFAHTLLSAAVAALVLAYAPSVEATTLAELSMEQVTDASTYIVRGTVTEVWTDLDSEGIVWTHARVSVSHVFKGPDSPTELVVDSIGGVANGQTTQVSSAARFSETEDVMLFLDQARDGALRPVGMMLGKFTIRRAPGESSRYAARLSMAPTKHYDARFLPHPPAAQRIYLNDLETVVEDRLAAGWDGRAIPGISSEKLREINAPARRIR